jgi:hypothetical protein
VSDYNKQVATELYEELLEVVSSLPDKIKDAEGRELVMRITCESLEKAIAALKTKV